MSQRLSFIDLFSGCGGLSEGFLSTGQYTALAHVEWELPMVQTLRHRLVQKWGHSEEDAKRRTIQFDIQKTNELIYGNWSDDSRSMYGKNNAEDIMKGGLKQLVGNMSVDIIIGGPPCQAYSIAGRAQDQNSMKDDYRNYLFESFVKVVEAFQPKAFVFENVPGLLSSCPGDTPVTERIFQAFSAIGYTIYNPKELKAALFRASDFTVPQHRDRVIIIGIRNDLTISLQECYEAISTEKKHVKQVSIWDAIGHLPKLYPLKESIKKDKKNISHEQVDTIQIKHHHPRYHNSRDIEFFRTWISTNMNNASSIDKINFYNNNMGKQSKHPKYRNLEWDKCSPTIVAHLYKDGLMFLHPDVEQARSITIKEAALLQSFPNDYEFIGSDAYCFKMIGNAVPPLMAKAIATALYVKFKGEGNENTSSV